VVRVLVTGALLAGPTALAFAKGGTDDTPRMIAGIAAWALVALLAVTGAPLPRSRAAWAAIAGIAGLAVWSAVSLSWAPLVEPGRDDVGRLVAYTGALAASAMAWRHRAELRLVEPGLAAGALVVALYGLSGRLLPGVVDLDASARSAGRLEQPLTYWNATGALAAFGLVLAARVAGSSGRPAALRAAAAAAGAPLGMAVYLSFSRGAIAALAAGLVVLLALSPTRAQLKAAAYATGAGLVAALVASLLPAVESLEGGSATRQGAIGLAALAVLAAAAGALQWRAARNDPDSPPYVLPRRAVAAAVAVAVLVGAPLAAVALDRGAATEPGATASRLNDLGSNRYDYWGVALGSFADHPLRGSGIAGFRVDWLRERDVHETVVDAHSLYLETPAELGVVGLLLLALLAGGIGAAGVAAARVERDVVAGAAAGITVFAVHAAMDWDWEMPAVALPALVLAGVLLCRGGLRTAGGSTG
jgi:hypothetical protein